MDEIRWSGAGRQEGSGAQHDCRRQSQQALGRERQLNGQTGVQGPEARATLAAEEVGVLTKVINLWQGYGRGGEG